VKTHASLPNTPPDYISIPEHLKSTPVASLRTSVRLGHLLQYARIRCLGDLHGKRLSEFEEYRGCGEETIRELRFMIVRALHPRVEPALTTWPIRVRDYHPPAQAIEVVHAIRQLRPGELPVSVRLHGVLQELDIKSLGQLHGLPIRELRARPRCGRKTVEELIALLGRAEAGEFTFRKQEIAIKTPAELPREIDRLISGLPELDREFLTLYFGATGRGPQTLRQIGQRHGVTRSRAGQRISRAVAWLRRQGSRRIQGLLDCVDEVCADFQVPLSTDLVSAWQERAHPFRYRPQFYIRLIPRLRPQWRARPGKPKAKG